jgi:hypothetical protein
MKDIENDPCSELTSPKRVNYFNGMLLTEEELQQEQSYQVEKQKLRLRYLHGYGTVCGLRVTLSEEDKPGFIVVEPGFALDKWGREIIVPEDVELDLNSYAQECDVELYVVLEYKEQPIKPIPILGATIESETHPPSSILETYKLDVWDQPPEASDHNRSGFNELLEEAGSTDLDVKHFWKQVCEFVIQPCNPCAPNPALTLAKVTIPIKGPITTADIDNCTYRPVAVSMEILIRMLFKTLSQ